MNRKKILVSVVIMTVSLAGIVAAMYVYSTFQSANQTIVKTSYHMLSPQQLNERLKNKNFFMLNVHTPYEGEIAGTDAFIAYDILTENITQLPQDKSAEILVYCRTGRMSAIAVQKLTELGYSNVFDLTGGMEAWQAQGYELSAKRSLSILNLTRNNEVN